MIRGIWASFTNCVTCEFVKINTITDTSHLWLFKKKLFLRPRQWTLRNKSYACEVNTINDEASVGRFRNIVVAKTWQKIPIVLAPASMNAPEGDEPAGTRRRGPTAPPPLPATRGRCRNVKTRERKIMPIYITLVLHFIQEHRVS